MSVHPLTKLMGRLTKVASRSPDEARQLVIDAYEAHRRAVYLMASDMIDHRPVVAGVSREQRTEQIAREYLGIAVALMRRDREQAQS